ncbi:hypothetical protein GCM10010151_66590 [Actinoallomurus spadix]|uniref:Uncharacterized protein n=1 Tax=Actinoallomurus spadix TaxID=79912 RepID=A0ABN0XLL9_9ACTN
MGHAHEGQQARPVDGAHDATLDGHVGPAHPLNDRSHAPHSAVRAPADTREAALLKILSPNRLCS